MPSHSSMLDLLLGTSTSALAQISTYTRTDAPILDASGASHGRRITIACEGWLANPAEQQSLAEQVEFRGQRVRIMKRGVAEIDLPLTGAIGDSPYLTVKFGAGNGESVPAGKPVTIEIVAEYSGDPYELQSTVPWPYAETETRRASELRVIKRRGLTLNPADATTLFETEVLSVVQAAFPLPEWVVTYELNRDSRDDKVEWSIEIKELAGDLPSTSRDGEHTETRNVEESGRVTVEHSYDLLLASDYTTVLAAIRPAGPLIRESVTVAFIQELRLRATFVTTEVTSGVIAKRQSVEIEENPAVYSVKRYSGAGFVAVEEPADARIVRVQGYAIATTSQSMPTPISTLYVSKPVVQREKLNPREIKTTWSYAAILDNATAFNPAWLDG